jgi:hypothetical protein
LVKDKGDDGTVYVLLDSDQTSPGGTHESPGGDQTSARTADWAATEGRTNELIEELRAQNEHLRSELSIRNEELRRKDTIIMTMAQRIPELEAPREPQESHETASEEPHSTHAPPEPQEPSQRRSWWRAFFGME